MMASRASGTQAARQEVARARVRARRAHALPTGLGRKTTGEVEVGRAGTGPGQVGCIVLGLGAVGKRQVKPFSLLSVFYFSYCFLFVSICFDLVQALNHFCFF